jgi:hypothetical protein
MWIVPSTPPRLVRELPTCSECKAAKAAVLYNGCYLVCQPCADAWTAEAARKRAACS